MFYEHDKGVSLARHTRTLDQEMNKEVSFFFIKTKTKNNGEIIIIITIIIIIIVIIMIIKQWLKTARNWFIHEL